MTSDEANILKTRSSEYLEEAERLVENKKWDLAMSALHLHCDLGVKSRLLQFGATYPRTHSLRELLRILSKFDQKVSILLADENSILRLSRLEEGYISSRYLPVRYSSEDVEPLLHFIRRNLMDIFLENDLKRLRYLKNYEKVVESVKAICLKHDPKARVILFGSVLRGNWTGDSDIDLLVILQAAGAKDRITVDVWRTIEAPVEIHFSSEEMLKNWYMKFIDVYKEI